MTNLLSGLNEAARRIHQDAVKKGFYDEPREDDTLLMLVVSELGEAMEADRKCHHTNPGIYDFMEKTDAAGKRSFFEDHIKDTFEDELADAVIRMLDLVAHKGIDLEWHIQQKLIYNKTRPHKHGKEY